MKKFMKGCAITALILVVLGFIMVTISGTISGTAVINDVVGNVTDGKMKINLGNEDGFGIYIDENSLFGTEVEYDITDNMIFEKGYEIFHGDVEKYKVGNDIDILDIEVGGSEFVFQESEDENFYIEAMDTGKFQSYIKADTLFIKSSQTFDNYGKIVLYIPAAYEFEKVDVELGAGLLEVDVLAADAVDFEVGAGQITINFLRADDCKVEVGMGEILVDDMQVEDVKADVGMGHLLMNGLITGDFKGDCAMGSMELFLSGSEEDFNYALAGAVGNVSVGGREYGGFAQEKKVDNGADKKITLDCAVGSVLVEFKSSGVMSRNE